MLKLLILYGSYRTDRAGIRLWDYLVRRFSDQGFDASLIDAKAVGLPMLDKRFKEFPDGTAPEAMARLADQVRGADAFVLVAGEYNWGVQPGLKNLTDHYLEEWFWRPCAIASYSAGRTAGVRAAYAWHPTVAEMGMAPVPATLACGEIARTLDETGQPQGAGGESLDRSFGKFAATLEWWAEAAKAQRNKGDPPY
jgi:NAD(P)H-dependent FMN reductase